MACRTDPSLAVIDTVTATLLDWFNPASACPAAVGSTTAIRFFAGDGAPLAAWDSHVSDGCNEPFVWLRAMRRYRSQTFPAPTVDANPCKLTKVIAIEIGVGWCAVIDQEAKWEQYAEEARISQDTAWRIEEVLCAVSRRLADDDHMVGTDTIAPYGPEGGVIAWTGVIYASYS